MTEMMKGEERRGPRGVGVRELEDSRRLAKNQNYRGSIQLASRHVKYYCLPRFIHSIFKRGERKALQRPPNIFHHWIIPPLRLSPLSPLAFPVLGHRCSTTEKLFAGNRPVIFATRFCVFLFFSSFARGNPRGTSIQPIAVSFVVDWLTGWFCIIKENTIENSCIDGTRST